ncbi:hypothetical protein ACQCVP_09235 [Rossellomorea vietnamensis]
MERKRVPYVTTRVEWIHELKKKGSLMYSPALLGYMSGANKSDICIRKSRVDT